VKNRPDFFLTAAGEVKGDLSTTRACWTKGRLRDEIRDDHMLIAIEPPLIGQTYGLGGQDIANLIISSRLQDFSLFPIKEWPCHVYITRILDESITKTAIFTRRQVEVIAWGMLFPTLNEATSFGLRNSAL
jgi:hypothetical protein